MALRMEGATTQISRLTESPSNIMWSPDGKWIAFTANVPSRETWRINMPTPPRGAKWTDPPKIVSKLNYRSDRIGFTDDGYRQLFVLPADGGTPRQVTTGGDSCKCSRVWWSIRSLPWNTIKNMRKL